jgi:tetratricopeptide (TPR) repeat protein
MSCSPQVAEQLEQQPPMEQERRELLQKALKFYEDLAQKDGPGAAERQEAAKARRHIGDIRLKLGDLPQAEQAYRQAVAVQKQLVTDFPDRPEYRRDLADTLGRLADVLVSRGDHAEAAKVAEELPGVLPKTGQAFFDAARTLARCVPLAEKDAKLPEAKRKELAKKYGDRAVELLRQAVAKGYRDAGPLRKDPAFAPLRSRADFQKVQAELEKAR